MALDKAVDSGKLNACLTAEANAIRAKTGGSANISFDFANEKGFADAIAAIPSGGGGGLPSASKNDVTFYDYDGAILYSYTAADFAALTAMPANPSHTGLTAQGWNWTLADAKTYVAAYGKLNIGQMYITDDGKTRLYILLDDISRPTVTIRFRQSAANGVTVDWGDGSTPETYSGKSAADHTHTYSETGSYIILLEVTSGTLYLEGSVVGGGYVGIMGSIAGASRHNHARLQKVEIGNSVTSIGNYAFQYCGALASITIPDSVTSINQYAFQYCYSLGGITLPNRVVSIGDYAFGDCPGLASLTIPNSVTSIGNYAFYHCYCLDSLTIPNSVTSIGNNAVSACNGLTSLTISSGVTSISNYAFSSNPSLQELTIPNSVTSIGAYALGFLYGLTSLTIPSSVTSISNSAFGGCEGIKYYYLKPQTPPNLANANAFSSIPSDCIMYVPYSADHSILEAYKVASNWSTYASYMQEEPQ